MEPKTKIQQVLNEIFVMMWEEHPLLLEMWADYLSTYQDVLSPELQDVKFKEVAQTMRDLVVAGTSPL